MLLAYYCDTQKQSSKEFVKLQLCRSLLFNKVEDRLKKILRHSVLQERLWKTALKIMFVFQAVLYTHSRKVFEKGLFFN